MRRQIPLSDREVSDNEFVARVRRHRPSALLPHVAQAASTRMEPESWFTPGTRGLFTPWALAEVTRVSLAYANEHRQPATFGDVTACNAAYNALPDPEPATDQPGVLARFLLRMTEQLDYQRNLLNELSRAAAVLIQTRPKGPLRVLVPGWEGRSRYRR